MATILFRPQWVNTVENLIFHNQFFKHSWWTPHMSHVGVRSTVPFVTSNVCLMFFISHCHMYVISYYTGLCNNKSERHQNNMTRYKSNSYDSFGGAIIMICKKANKLWCYWKSIVKTVHIKIVECFFIYLNYMDNVELSSIYSGMNTIWTEEISGMDMMTSSNGNIFRVTGHLCGEFPGPRWIPRTKASDAELWHFLWSASE